MIDCIHITLTYAIRHLFNRIRPKVKCFERCYSFLKVTVHVRQIVTNRFYFGFNIITPPFFSLHTHTHTHTNKKNPGLQKQDLPSVIAVPSRVVQDALSPTKHPQDVIWLSTSCMENSIVFSSKRLLTVSMFRCDSLWLAAMQNMKTLSIYHPFPCPVNI